MMTVASYKPCWDTDDNGRRQLCRSWNDCPGREFYEMSDIQYCRHQVLWLLSEGIEDYIDGKWETAGTWPDDPATIETGYNDTPVQTSVSSHAGFEGLRQVAGELSARLERTGKDGRLLGLEAREGRVLRYEVGLKPFSQDARNALNYCAGYRRKGMNYERWLWWREMRKAQRKIYREVH